MTDKFIPTTIEQLLKIILNQFDKYNSIFGIPKELFFVPKHSDPFRFQRFEQLLENPIGVAAGPHTQLAQNIIAAWLCGARYIELKTVQTLDELDVSKPCIDMQDEGYNCEWSQELKIKESFDQYLNAWIIIHVLKHKFGWDLKAGAGVIFNMSVGYNLEGILKGNIQWFLDKMMDANAELKQKIESLKNIYPEIDEIIINPCISNNITLSTMHGCPPEEIEKIGIYLLREKNLHTTIKLNPTLLGKEKLAEIIANSGFETQVPDIAFEHDLKYPDAIELIKNLQEVAHLKKLHFGLKLTNTLESLNHKNVFHANEKMMYASGKILHPIAILVAQKLQNEFKGELDISFSAGVDAFNIADVISCGIYPATVCSDILKPGGYSRLNHYVQELSNAFVQRNSESIETFIINSKEIAENKWLSIMRNLEQYSVKVLIDKAYKKDSFRDKNIKTKKELGNFDCIHAPCEYTCPTNQGIPDYMYHTADGDFDSAYKTITQTNPFPLTTGTVCDHVCQSKCTRINYDSPLLIREIKKFNALHADLSKVEKTVKLSDNYRKVAIIGAGPSGLSCAYFLALAGFDIHIYESKSKAGGMVSSAIPDFRLNDSNLNIDLDQIQKLGVKIHFNHKIDKEAFNQLNKESEFIYIAAGAQKARSFFIEGMDDGLILNPLQFLYDAKAGRTTHLGKNIAIIGGGNTAIDVARTAKRLVEKEGKVQIIYRRTRKQMPASYEEIKEALNEGIEILELLNPLKINSKDNKIVSLTCQKMQLGDKDPSGREKSIAISNSEFEIKCDTIIPAVGQELDIDFIENDLLGKSISEFETKLPNVFIGGDAVNGGLSIIAAVGDGRKVAQLIIDKSGIDFKTKESFERNKADYKMLMIKKAQRINPNEIQKILKSESEAINEASRCLLCDELCNICTTVCPNLALFAYPIEPFSLHLEKLSTNNKEIIIGKGEMFEIKQNTQIVHIADWCNQCGNCNTFCPTNGAPYQEKPHLHLSRLSFDSDLEGYYFDQSSSENTILYKNGKEMRSLTENSVNYFYSTNDFKLHLNKQSFKIQKVELQNDFNEVSLVKAVEMSIILKAVKLLNCI